MSFLFSFLLLLAHKQIIGPVTYQSTKSCDDLEFLDDFPILIHGGSFFTFDTTSLIKQKFIFVVSATRIAYFKMGNRLFIVSSVKREIRQNRCIDFFEGSGYKVRLDVLMDKKTGKSRVRHTGFLELTRNQNVTTVRVQGMNEKYEPDSAR